MLFMAGPYSCNSALFRALSVLEGFIPERPVAYRTRCMRLGLTRPFACRYVAQVRVVLASSKRAEL
jgi:hypothetical protein